MHTYVAFLRGINVGGQKKILMSDLRSLFEALGFSGVRTYIQSGNVIFSTDKDVDLAGLIYAAIQEKYDWEVPVFVKTPSELKEILTKCPFAEEKKAKSYFTLLSEAPDPGMIEELQQVSSPNEEFVITPNCIYFYSSIGYGRTKYNTNFIERKLKVKTTARNYRTMLKLSELVQSSF
jgi:uncharacterized protein (DUF1697 family)